MQDDYGNDGTYDQFLKVDEHGKRKWFTPEENYILYPGGNMTATEVKDRLVEDLNNPDQAMRLNRGKPKMSLLPHQPLVEVTKVLMNGAIKYDEDNWRKGLPYKDTISSLERHVGDFKDGEDYDHESGLLLMAHVACNALFLIQYHLDGLGETFDDRYKKEKQE